LTLIRPGSPWRPGAVARNLLLPLALALALGACSSNSNRGVTGNVGVGTGVALTTPGSVTQIQVATTIVITASVTADVNNAGVTFALSGDAVALGATLTDITATTATFNAPASVQGATDGTITATSVVNSASSAAVTIVVLGSPVPTLAQLFPGNVNVPYGASISVAGGEADYTWALAAGSGPLPPGIALTGSTTSETSIAGTPTTAGSYTFTVQATDALSRVASQTLTMQVLPQATCLLSGTFSFMVSGYRGGGPMTHAGSFTVDASGNITGEQDYKDGHRTTTHEALIPLGAGSPPACINRQTNSGQITLNAPSGAILYNFSVTPPDAQGNLNSARLQLIGSGADSASGELTRLDSNAVTAAPPTGSFAFGLITLANQEPSTLHYGSAGYLTTNSAGTISVGLMDSNGPATLTAAPLTGTLSAPDSNGRGTASLAAGGQSTSLVYYMINAGRMYLMDIGATVASPRSTGYMTAQVGDAADGSFDNGALASASASIMSLWGGEGSDEPLTVMDLGRLANGNAAAGTLDALLDSSDHDTDAAGITYSAQPYTVASNGRGTLSLTSAGVTRSFVLYLDGIADGYVVEKDSPAGSTGLLEAQYVPTGGSFSDTLPGLFVGGTQFAMVPGPIVLIPGANISFGNLSSTYSNGLFAIDAATGRGFGSMSQSGVAETAAVVYEVSPTKFEILTFGTIQVDGTMLWMIQQ
jgi:hypothetical protein